jgi:hypothetical protein
MTLVIGKSGWDGRISLGTLLFRAVFVSSYSVSNASKDRDKNLRRPRLWASKALQPRKKRRVDDDDDDDDAAIKKTKVVASDDEERLEV